MPRGKGSKHDRGNVVSKYKEAWADGAYNRENSEDEEEQHEGPQPVRSLSAYVCLLTIATPALSQITAYSYVW